jgi:hypothetical protein
MIISQLSCGSVTAAVVPIADQEKASAGIITS